MKKIVTKKDFEKIETSPSFNIELELFFKKSKIESDTKAKMSEKEIKIKHPKKLLKFVEDKPLAVGILILSDYKEGKYTVKQLIKQYSQ